MRYIYVYVYVCVYVRRRMQKYTCIYIHTHTHSRIYAMQRPCGALVRQTYSDRKLQPRGAADSIAGGARRRCNVLSTGLGLGFRV